MPFDNFYEESDKAARHWRKFLVIGFLVVVGYSIISFLTVRLLERPEPSSNEPTSASERVRHVDELCTSLPKPEQFIFTERNTPIQYDGATAVVYHYQSDRKFEEIMPAFLVWFDSNGWKRVADSDFEVQSAADNKLSFTNGKQTVSISYYSFDYPNYKLYCHEKSIRVYD